MDSVKYPSLLYSESSQVLLKEIWEVSVSFILLRWLQCPSISIPNQIFRGGINLKEIRGDLFLFNLLTFSRGVKSGCQVERCRSEVFSVHLSVHYRKSRPRFLEGTGKSYGEEVRTEGPSVSYLGEETRFCEIGLFLSRRFNIRKYFRSGGSL